MSRPTKISKHLRHEFTSGELAELGGKLADQYDSLQNENDRFESDKAYHKAEISGIEKEVARLSRLIRARFEERLTECYFRWNAPIDGVVQIVRNDTGEIVQERSMSDDERQEELPLEAAPEQPSETPAAETPAETTETIAAEIKTPAVEAEAATAAD